MLAQYGVNAYITGHDHDMEHLQDKEYENLHYIVSGAGSKVGIVCSLVLALARFSSENLSHTHCMSTSPHSPLQPTAIDDQGLINGDEDIASLLYARGNSGYATLQISATTLQLEFFNYEGHHLYRARIPHPHPRR